MDLFRPKKKPQQRRQRTKYTPEQQMLKREIKFMDELKTLSPGLYTQLMLERVRKSMGGAAMLPQAGAAAAGGNDELRDKLVEIALGQLSNGPGDKLADSLHLVEAVMSFANGLPRQDSPPWQSILSEGLKSAPEMLKAMAMTTAASRGQLVVEQEPPAQEPPRRAIAPVAEAKPPEVAPPAAATPTPVKEEPATVDPIAALIDRIVPLLDLAPTEAAPKLLAVLAAAEAEGNPGVPLAKGLLERDVDELGPMLLFARLHPVYGALARRLLEPAGRDWLRAVQEELYRLDGGEEGEEEEGEG